ncbi:MAG: ATP-binding protein [Planctomycetota bacterium]
MRSHLAKMSFSGKRGTPWGKMILAIGACTVIIFGLSEVAGRLLFETPSQNPYHFLYLTRGVCIALLSPLLAMCVLQKDRRYQNELMHRDRLALIGLLTSGIAHELRNPLSVIRTSLFLMKDKLPEDFAAAHHIERVEKHVRSAQEVVDSLLTLARGGEVNIVSVPMAEVIEEVGCLITAHDWEKVDIDLPTSQAVVRGDRNLVRIVVLNLVLNALHAVRERGGGRVQVHTQTDGQLVTTCVTDNGPGLSRDAVALLGKPLSTRKSGGTGVGLALSGLLMQKLKGKMEVESIEGVGTTFSLILPAA